MLTLRTDLNGVWNTRAFLNDLDISSYVTNINIHGSVYDLLDVTITLKGIKVEPLEKVD